MRSNDSFYKGLEESPTVTNIHLPLAIPLTLMDRLDFLGCDTIVLVDQCANDFINTNYHRGSKSTDIHVSHALMVGPVNTLYCIDYSFMLLCKRWIYKKKMVYLNTKSLQVLPYIRIN